MKFLKVLILLIISAKSFGQYQPIYTPTKWTQGGFDSLFIPARDTITPGDKTKPWITYRAPTLYVWTTNKWTAISSGNSGGSGGTDYVLPQADSVTRGGITYNTDLALDLNNRLGIAPGKKALWNTIANLPLFYATGDSTRRLVHDSAVAHDINFSDKFIRNGNNIDLPDQNLTEKDSIYIHDPAHFITYTDVTNLQSITDTSIHPPSWYVRQMIEASRKDTVKFNSAQFYKTPDDVVNIYSSGVGGSSNAVVTTTDSLVTLANIDPSTVYETTDKGGGFWRYDPFDITTPDNVGTVRVNGTKRLKRIYSGSIDVRWFGAKGDGITDDRQAIINAINYVSASTTGIVYFPAGNYFCSDSIPIKIPVHLKGDATWFTNYTRLTFATGKHGLVFYSYNTPVTEPAKTVGAEGSEVEGLSFYQVSPFTHGCAIWSHVRVNIHDCFIDGWGGDGIKIEAGAIPSNLWSTVQRVDMNDRGSGYTVAPTVTITGDGSGATAHAVISGAVTGYSLNNGGSFTAPPYIRVYDDPIVTRDNILTTGYGAAFNPVMGVGVGTVLTGGAGYTSATVSFTGGAGTGAAGTVQLSGGVVTGITITSPGSGYTAPPTVTIIGNGTGATAKVDLTITALTLRSTGGDYEVAPTIYAGGGISGVGDDVAIGTAILSNWVVKRVELDNKGTGYTNATATISGNAKATAVLGSDIQGNANNTKITNCKITHAANGVFISGGDANAGYTIGVDATANRLNGIWDNSFLGNKHVSAHTNSNGLHAYFSTQLTSTNDFDGCYSEGNQMPSIGLSSARFTGGDQGAGIDNRSSAAVVLNGVQGAIKMQTVGTKDYINYNINANVDLGELEYLQNSSMTSAEAVRRKIDRKTGDISMDAGNSANNRYYLRTGKYTQTKFGGTNNVPYATYIDRLYLGGSGGRKLTSSSTFPPSKNSGQTGWVRGDYVINSSPSTTTGLVGWSRLTTGATDTLGVDWLEVKTPVTGSASDYILNSPATPQSAKYDIVGSSHIANLTGLSYSSDILNTPLQIVTRSGADGWTNALSMYQSGAASGAYFATPATNKFSLSTGGYAQRYLSVTTYTPLETTMTSYAQQTGKHYFFAGTGLTPGTELSLPIIATLDNTGLSLTGSNPTAGLNLPASTTARASFNVPTGTAPTSPVNGDHYSNGTHEFVRLAGVWVQVDNDPASSFGSQSANTVYGNHTSSSAAPSFGKMPVQTLSATGSSYNGTKFLRDDNTWATVTGGTGTTSSVYSDVGTDVTTTSTNVSDITGLSFSVDANTIYKIEGALSVGCSGTGGMKFAMNGPTGTQLNTQVLGHTTSFIGLRLEPISAINTLTSTFITVATTQGSIQVKGTIKTGSTAGTIQLRFAAGVAGQISTVYGGNLSYLSLTPRGTYTPPAP